VIAPRLAPPAIAQSAQSSRRGSFGLTSRTFFLFAAGLVLIAPAWIDRRALAVLVVWDGRLVAGHLLDKGGRRRSSSRSSG
jgi:hypothetical protein